MLISREREKLLNAIIYFVQNTKHCHTLKLFKLLNFLDFEHYRQTGRTVTGLNYVAWDQGPAPNALWHELEKGGEADFQKSIALAKVDNGDIARRDMKPRAAFNKRLFSRRELEIMERVAELFRDLRGDKMSDYSHSKDLPWKRVYGGGEGKGKAIPPELAMAAPPLMDDVPTIDEEEVEFRKALRAGLQ